MRIESESGLWLELAKVVRHEGWFAERFEDPGSLGKPDAFVGAGPNRCWLELKYQRIRYRKGQEAWAIRAQTCGERAMTVLYANDCLQVYHTADVARAHLGLTGPPAPIYQGSSLSNALHAALGKPQKPPSGPSRAGFC